MPIHFRYHTDRQLLVQVGIGQVSIEEIETLRDSLRQAGIPLPVLNTITDMRKAQFGFDLNSIRANEEGMGQEDYTGARHAALADDSRTTAYMMAWRGWLPPTIEVEVFSVPESAYSWLGVQHLDGDLDF